MRPAPKRNQGKRNLDRAAQKIWARGFTARESEGGADGRGDGEINEADKDPATHYLKTREAVVAWEEENRALYASSGGTQGINPDDKLNNEAITLLTSGPVSGPFGQVSLLPGQVFALLLLSPRLSRVKLPWTSLSRGHCTGPLPSAQVPLSPPPVPSYREQGLPYPFFAYSSGGHGLHSVW